MAGNDLVEPGPRLLARTTIVASAFFVVVMYVAFLFIQPELNPLYRYGSEYAVGRMGWLMKAAFFVWGTGLLAFALAQATGLDREARSPTGIALFAIAAVGVFIAGTFDGDLQVVNPSPPPLWIEPPPSDSQKLHALGGMVTFLALMPGAGLVSRRLRRAGRLRGPYRWLRGLSWLIFVAFLAFAFGFVSIGLAGLGQRLFLGLLFTWLLMAGWGLERGAFAAAPGDPGR